jgi:hypothetical protein
VFGKCFYKKKQIGPVHIIYLLNDLSFPLRGEERIIPCLKIVLVIIKGYIEFKIVCEP